MSSVDIWSVTFDDEADDEDELVVDDDTERFVNRDKNRASPNKAISPVSLSTTGRDVILLVLVPRVVLSGE